MYEPRDASLEMRAAKCEMMELEMKFVKKKLVLNKMHCLQNPVLNYTKRLQTGYDHLQLPINGNGAGQTQKDTIELKDQVNSL